MPFCTYTFTRTNVLLSFLDFATIVLLIASSHKLWSSSLFSVIISHFSVFSTTGMMNNNSTTFSYAHDIFISWRLFTFPWPLRLNGEFQPVCSNAFHLFIPTLYNCFRHLIETNLLKLRFHLASGSIVFIHTDWLVFLHVFKGSVFHLNENLLLDTKTIFAESLNQPMNVFGRIWRSCNNFRI